MAWKLEVCYLHKDQPSTKKAWQKMTPVATRRFCKTENPYFSWKKNFFSQFTLLWYWSEVSNGITSNSWSYYDDAQKPRPWVIINLFYKKPPNVMDFDTSLQVSHSPESNKSPSSLPDLRQPWPFNFPLRTTYNKTMPDILGNPIFIPYCLHQEKSLSSQTHCREITVLANIVYKQL